MGYRQITLNPGIMMRPDVNQLFLGQEFNSLQSGLSLITCEADEHIVVEAIQVSTIATLGRIDIYFDDGTKIPVTVYFASNQTNGGGFPIRAVGGLGEPLKMDSTVDGDAYFVAVSYHIETE